MQQRRALHAISAVVYSKVIRQIYFRLKSIFVVLWWIHLIKCSLTATAHISHRGTTDIPGWAISSSVIHSSSQIDSSMLLIQVRVSACLAPWGAEFCARKDVTIRKRNVETGMRTVGEERWVKRIVWVRRVRIIFCWWVNKLKKGCGSEVLLSSTSLLWGSWSCQWVNLESWIKW